MLNPFPVLALILSLCIGLMTALPVTAALDADVEHGAQLFSANCAACHMGGGNVIRASRTLSQQDLQAHLESCLLYTSPSPRDRVRSRMPSSA